MPLVTKMLEIGLATDSYRRSGSALNLLFSESNGSSVIERRVHKCNSLPTPTVRVRVGRNVFQIIHGFYTRPILPEIRDKEVVDGSL
jgi:hypothetical protein